MKKSSLILTLHMFLAYFFIIFKKDFLVNTFVHMSNPAVEYKLYNKLISLTPYHRSKEDPKQKFQIVCHGGYFHIVTIAICSRASILIINLDTHRTSFWKIKLIL